MFARQSYWCIVETLKQAGWRHLALPCLRARIRRVGFVLAGQEQWRMPERLRRACVIWT